MKLCAIDFETDAIQPRPRHPPRPVGVAVKPFGRKAYYMSWGHPTGNDCSHDHARNVLLDLGREYTFVMHNAKFDLDVGETHLGVAWPAAWHDTFLMAFLVDPESPSLSLKTLAERYLGEPPAEQDMLKQYILDRAKEKHPDFKGATAKNFGGYIAPCPGTVVRPYAIGDVERTEKLFRFLWDQVKNCQLRGAYERELKVTRTLVRMERRGVPIARVRLKADVSVYEAAKRVIEEPLLKKLKIPAKQRAEVLDRYDEQDAFKWSGKGFAEQLLRSGLVKTLPQTDKGNDSTSAESLATVMPAKLAKEFEVRSQIATCLQTFMRPWLLQATENDGLWFGEYNQFLSRDEYGRAKGARTGRLSMTPNLQNVIRSDKDPRVPKLRDYVVPGKKYGALVERDYSQQELRILAHYEDGPLKDAYLADPSRDGHVLVQQLIRHTVGIEIERRKVKDLNFAMIYGQGNASTAEKMDIELDVAKSLRAAHKRSLPGIPNLQREIKARCKVDEPIWTWGGRRYYCEPAKMVDGEWWTFEYKMLNKLIQGSAADCTKAAMVNYDESLFADACPMLLQVHDSLLLGVPKGADPKKAHEALRDCMADVEFDVPMLSDGKTSRVSWHQMKKAGL